MNFQKELSYEEGYKNGYKDGHTDRVKQERKKTEDKVHKHYQEEIGKIIEKIKIDEYLSEFQFIEDLQKLIDTN